MFESEAKKGRSAPRDPIVLVRLTALLQERIAALARIVRDQKFQHVVTPLTAADYAWSARHLYSPESHLFLDSSLCASAIEVWVECSRRPWRENDPPERITSGRLKLQEIIAIGYMPTREIRLPPLISGTTAIRYAKRLRALREATRVHEMLSHAAYAMEREVPDGTPMLA